MPAPRRTTQQDMSMDSSTDSRTSQQSYANNRIKRPFVVSINRLFALVVIVSFLVGGVSGAFFASTGIFSSLSESLSNKFSAKNSVSSVDTTTMQVEEESQTIDVVKNANESVVSIIITKDLSKFYNSTGPNTFPFDDFFFPSEIPQGKQEIGGGTGFIVGEDGLIVTNKHVVSDAEAEYTVLLNNRESFAAKVVAIDPLNDVAFVKIETGSNLPTLELGDSDTLQIGQTVIAIGNALGEYRNTVTRGIVSGLARTVIAGDGNGSEETLDNVIQTDAAINPGNSGGPLLNLAGQVIGVNTAISLEGQLIGFAIPINQISRAIESVKTHGRVVRPMLGVRYMTVTADLAKQNELDVDYGALIVEGSSKNEPAVIAGSPADRAGIVANDIILSLNGTKIEGDNTLSRLIQQFNVGDEVTLEFLHDGETKTATVALDELTSS